MKRLFCRNKIYFNIFIGLGQCLNPTWFFFVLLHFFVITCSQTQTPLFVHDVFTIDNYANDNFNNMLCTDNGDCFILGNSQAKDEETVIAPHYGKYDIYLYKFTKTGQLLWVKNYGTSESDTASSFLLDDDGNIIILGTSEEQDFDLATKKGMMMYGYLKYPL